MRSVSSINWGGISESQTYRRWESVAAGWGVQLPGTGGIAFRWRNFLPLPALLVILGLQRWSEPVSPEAIPQLRLAAALLLALGFAGRVWIVGHVPPGTSDKSTRSFETPSLNTTGAYSLVRHPIYGANLLLWLAMAVLSGYPTGVVAGVVNFVVGYRWVVAAEESFLRERFGEAYVAWAAATPRFIPRFDGYRPWSESFDLRRALPRELQIWSLVGVLCLLIEWGRSGLR